MPTDAPPTLSVLVLDYLKEAETRACLESLRAHIKTRDYEIVYLDNGGGADYAWWLYQEGLCDVLISKRHGMGGGVGQTDLFRWARAPYSLFVQNDQVLARDLTELDLAYFRRLLNGAYRCIDLNGDQSGKGIWTDRAHMVKTSYFNGLAPFPNGGPGPLHHLRWNENYLQERVRPNEIAHPPAFFADKGVWSIREVGGGVVRMRTDTKQVWWDRRPSERYMFPEMTDTEWAASLGGSWVGGTVPEAYLAHSFNCWGDVS